MDEVKIREIVRFLEDLAPLDLQESYDNCGLQVGNPDEEVRGILISLDVTEEVVEEALRHNCNLIIAHHPLIFKGLKSITGRNYVERTLVRAIQGGVGIYAIHTNLDSIHGGVNSMICKKLGIKEPVVADPRPGQLVKLVTFVPEDHVEEVRKAIFSAGAGHMGNYDWCSFQSSGKGTFRGLDGAQPFVGQVGQLHIEPEVRIETILPVFLKDRVVTALKKTHPYEEVAYDLYPLSNPSLVSGVGMVGILEEDLPEMAFLELLKKTFGCGVVRHSPLTQRRIKKVAVCGGSGSQFLKSALRHGADAFVSADFRYHDFFDAEGRILMADIGHYESEYFTCELLRDHLLGKFPNFAARISEIVTNPVNYF